MDITAHPTVIQNEAAERNDSGHGAGVHPAIPRFRLNWGSLVFTWIWMMRNGLSLPAMIVLVLGGIVPTLIDSALRAATDLNIVVVGLAWIAWFCRVGGLLVVLYMFVAGHRQAWRYRRFESVEQFMKVQRAWDRWALGVLVICAIAYGVALIMNR